MSQRPPDHPDDPRDDAPSEADFRIDRVTGDADGVRGDLTADIGELDAAAASLGVALTERKSMPASLRASLIAEGEGILAARSGGATASDAPPAPIQMPKRSAWPGVLAAAASVALLAGTAVGVWGWRQWQADQQQLQTAQVELTRLRDRIESNDQVLADARARMRELETSLQENGTSLTEAQTALAVAETRALDLATLLDDATSDLDRALLKVAQYETPVDPAELKMLRDQLLQVPKTARYAFAPFDLPGNPAEQGDVRGEVVWNDERQQGFMRFEGLKVNDPAEEVYQIWVIDERGMEQKVSGGVFNATAQGEIIVPIHPGIDVGSVALFAVTIEDPGGTWVPNLERRVIVAQPQ